MLCRTGSLPQGQEFDTATRNYRDSAGASCDPPPSPRVCIVTDVVYDVRQEQFPTVIREMIRHENDVTNHRIMWLLVGEGFAANAYVSAKNVGAPTYFVLGLVGMLVGLSAFVMLYRSYQARGYLQFLGQQAKQGTLREEHLPLIGWPRNRIKGWWRNAWVCPCFRQTRDLLELWLLLPCHFTSMWMMGLMHAGSSPHKAVVFILRAILSAVVLSMSCILLVWSQSKDDERTEGCAQVVRAVLART